MNKRLFILLIVLMSLSLIGIIFVQGYWINNTFRNNEDQFSFNAKQVLISVSGRIQYKEFEQFYFPFRALLDSLKQPDMSAIDKLLSIEKKNPLNQKLGFSNRIQEEEMKLSESFEKSDIAGIKLQYEIEKQKAKENEQNNGLSSESRLEKISQMGNYERQLFENTIQHYASRIPIHKRVSTSLIRKFLDQELQERDIMIDYEFAIFSNELSTRIRSEDFSLHAPTAYSVPIFVNEDGISNYQLFVNFTGKKKFVLSSVIGMALLSIVFTLIIVIAYFSALSQLMQQRQISQIKTDFINNMTHELKTPIATINLALDALRNPKISADISKYPRYLGMIREENKRMHAQVENVLRISQLQKNELNIKKERLELHDIIEDAITHVSLIVENRAGYIKNHLGALKSTILANDFHFTNVLVNILENGVKYSEGKPCLDIYTENVKNSIVLRIRDQGIGMSKTAQKKIFDKFFREHTGDLHNVRGHGLGLTYVKRIVDDHHGQIWVASEKGKGTTFTIKLPLIS